MAYTTTQLITRSYYLSGIVARGLQTVSGEQITDGLYLLNAYIAVKTADTVHIPYFQEFNFTLTASQETYFIENLLHIETFTFFINNVRYSTAPVNRKTYFGSGRIENISSLPFSWHQERCLNGSNLYLYFEPQSDYEAQIWGKFSLGSVVLGQDLSLTLDQFYIEYLRYGLAEYIADENNVSLPPQTSRRLSELEAIIQSVSPPDLTLSKISSLSSQGGLNLGDVNIGHGWRPGN